MTTPSGYVPTATGHGTTATDSNPSPSGTTPARSRRRQRHAIDFGFYQPVTIGDFVWNDTNGNGMQDSGEPGIFGVTLTLAGLTGTGAITQTTTTDASGHYLFTEPPGTYAVTVDTANFTGTAGYVAIPPRRRSRDRQPRIATPVPAAPMPGTFPGGGSDLTIDFGFYQPITIGNFVWNDTNGNGVQDSGRAGDSGRDIDRDRHDG